MLFLMSALYKQLFACYLSIFCHWYSIKSKNYAGYGTMDCKSSIAEVEHHFKLRMCFCILN